MPRHSLMFLVLVAVLGAASCASAQSEMQPSRLDTVALSLPHESRQGAAFSWSNPSYAARPAQGVTQPPGAAAEHAFWDKENDWLFAAVGASRTLDYFSTLNMRRRGRDEILLTNEIVDNHAAFAAIEAGGVAVSIGASYLFHRYHHHKLERWTSIIHASLATTGAVRNYCLKTAHPGP